MMTTTTLVIYIIDDAKDFLALNIYLNKDEEGRKKKKIRKKFSVFKQFCIYV